MIINHNLNANMAIRNMGVNSGTATKSMEKLSSGLRINRASDDAAGLAISEKMRGQIRGLDQASSNALDGISLTQTAEGSLNETQNILQRMRELAVQATNGTLTSDDRSNIQVEANQLVQEIDKIGNQTEFNGKKLLNGNIGTTATSNNAFSDGNSKTAILIRNTTADTTGSDSITAFGTAGTKTATATTGAFAGGFTNDSITITNTASGKSYAVSLADNDDAQGVVEKFNAIKDQSGVEAFITAGTGGSAVVLRSTDYGSNSAFTVTGTGGGTALTKAGIGAVTNGADAAITTANAATYTADGNTITLTSGAAKGVALDIVGTEDAATNEITGAFTAGAAGDTVTINGVSKTLTLGEGATNTALVAAINTMTRDTGVTAQTDGTGIKLTSLAKGDGASATFATTGTLAIAAGGAGVVAGTDNITAASAANMGSIDVTANKVQFHVGANTEQTMDLRVSDMRSSAIGTGTVGTYLNGAANLNNVSDLQTKNAFSTVNGAEDAIKVLDAAMSKVSSERSNLGAVQNRLEHTITNLGTTSENMTAAESRIRDVDMAKEMTTFSKNNILAQAAQAMLSQANQQPQQVLQLLR